MGLEFDRKPRSVTEVEYLDLASLFVNPIVDTNVSVDHLPKSKPRQMSASHTRKSAKQGDMVEQCRTEATGCLGIVFRDPVEQVLQVS